MEASNFFTRLLQAPKESAKVKQVDDLAEFDAAWTSIRETLEQPDERQLVRGISSTQVPAHLRRIVDALVYESNRTDEDTTGACLEYFLKNDLLAQLERLCEADRPHGIKAEVLRAINNLIVSLSERFLVHNAVHRPLRRLLRSCVGEEPEEKVDGSARVVGAASMSPNADRRASNEDIEEELVNLMCTLASRMVAYPPLLLIFFHDKGWLHPHPSRTPSALDRALSPTPSGFTGHSDPSARNSTSAKTTHHFEFLLFSYLLRFVHREGQVGDPARAGLLFLFDIAFLPPSEQANISSPQPDAHGSDPLQDARDAFGEFILDGDFAEVMAAGLGAIYSLLPSKLHVPSLAVIADSEEEQQASASGGMHLGAGLDKTEMDMPSSTDPDVRAQLDLILKLFGFLQDIIHRCNSPILHSSAEDIGVSTTHILGSAISDATLDAIQSSFLDNVLYPSVLECSSHDGSAVAVLTYLDVICSNLDDGPLLHRILTFLMDTQDSDHPNTNVIAKKARAKRKTGAMGFVQQAVHIADYFADEGRFTLKDLILDNLHSSDWTANTAALRLLRSLLSDHCSQSVRGLLSAIKDPAATALAKRPIPFEANGDYGETILPAPINSTDMHLHEIELYSSLITRIDPMQPPLEVAAGYAVYLTDMQAALEADKCFRLSQIPLHFLGEDEKKSLLGFSTGIVGDETIQHRLSPSDPVIGALLDLLASFLGNTPDENVALTGVVTSIALCPNRSLVGWLLYDVKTETDPWATSKKLPKGLDETDDLFDPLSDSDSDSDIDIDAAPASHADPLTARASVDLPAIYQILRELVKTISGFRNSIDSFNRLLSERRQGLLFAAHLDEAMNLMLDVDTSAFGLPSTPTQAKKPKRPSAVGLASSLKSFLTPKRKGTTPSTPASGSGAERSTPRLGGLFGSSTNNVTPSAGSASTPTTTDPLQSRRPSMPDINRSTSLFAVDENNAGPSTPGPAKNDGSISPSPFMAHYEQASTSLDVDRAQSSAVIASGPWSPASNPIGAVGRFDSPSFGGTENAFDDVSMAGTLASTDLRGGTFGEQQSPKRDLGLEEEEEDGDSRMMNGRGQTKVKLSVILDNCVILEEFIKELVAVITARRALGIDQVGFV